MPRKLRNPLRWIILFSLALGSSASHSFAADPTEVPESSAADTWEFDAAFGAALTSDYIFRGITQTDHEPALQGYLDLSVRHLLRRRLGVERRFSHARSRR